jgi:ubiquitin-protein ligase E3 C
MDYDEFFSHSTTTTTTPPTPQNPVTFDELTALSCKLLNIAFTLYWREDQTNVLEGLVPGGLRLKWAGVRENVTCWGFTRGSECCCSSV